MSVSFGSWKVLEAKRVVICIGLWGLEDLCLVCSVFGGCFSEVLLRYERLPFASQLGWLGLLRHDARHWSNTVASEFTQTRVTSCGLASPSGAARQSPVFRIFLHVTTSVSSYVSVFLLFRLSVVPSELMFQHCHACLLVVLSVLLRLATSVVRSESNGEF